MNKIRELVRSWLPLGPFSRSVSILAGGTALGQALTILVVPVLTRLYSAEDFGYFQIYLSVMSFAALAVTLRYEQAILLPEQEETSANLVVVTLCTVGAISLLFACTAWLVQRYGLLPVSAQGLRPYLWLVPIGICGAGLYQTLSFWALRQKVYSHVAGTKLVQVGCQLSTQAIMGFLRSGPVGLLLGDVIGRTTGSLSLARLLRLRSWETFRCIRWDTMWAAAVRYRRFPLVSSGSALLNIAGYALPTLLIAQLYGPKTLGWFALGDRVLGVPATLIGQAVSQVYSVEAASLSTSNPKAMHALFVRSVKRLALLGAAPFLILFLLSPPLFGFVFGASWREAGVYSRLLALMHYLAFVTWPLMPTLNILEQQFWQLAWDVGRLVLTMGSLWLAYRWGSSARGAIGTLGAAMGLGYVSYLLLSQHAITRRIREFRTSAASQLAPRQQLAELREP